MSLDELRYYLTKTDINNIELMGILGILIIKKDILKKNSDVGEFIEYVVGEKFPGYVIKSRTLMSARINRILVNIDEQLEIKKISTKILDYIDIHDDEENSNKRVKRKMKMTN